MALLLDEINTLVVKNIQPGLADNFFKNGPLMALMKKRHQVWTGGDTVQENYIFAPMKVQSYRKGANFDITKRQTKSGMQFGIRFYESNCTEYKEDIQVIVRGPEAVLNLVQADLANCALSISAVLEIDFWQNGQNVGGVDRSDKLNGMVEALSDGVNPSWDGNIYTSYGGQTRIDVAPALNSPTGLIAANVAGGITYRVLEHSYQSCVIGSEHPTLGVTSNRCMGFINENFQPQQRIDTMEAEIGFTGIKFKGATIVESQYMPGQDGVNDADLGNYLSTGELFAWLNPGPTGPEAYMKLYFAADPEYQFGFTGFKPAQDNTVVAGQVLFAGNTTWRAPRLMRILFGITN